MSEKIDWSKAPEWAIGLGLIGAGRHSVWFDDDTYTYVDGRQMGGRYAFSGDGFHEWSRKGIACVKMRPSTPSWSGEGLPPVGTVCEMHHESWQPNNWPKVTVKYASAEYFITEDGAGEQHWHAHSVKFRPIRTPEQIAADEREAAIKEIQREIMPAHEYTAELILDAVTRLGYRKP